MPGISSATMTSWLIITLLLGTMCTFAIWTRAKTKLRGLSVVGFLLAMPISAVSLLSALGHPVTYITGLTVPVGDWKIIGVKIVKDEAMYVMVDVGDRVILAALPWDSNEASRLQDLLDDPDKKDTLKLKVKPTDKSFANSFGTIHELYADPQEKQLPPKDRPEQKPENKPQTLDTI